MPLLGSTLQQLCYHQSHCSYWILKKICIWIFPLNLKYYKKVWLKEGTVEEIQFVCNSKWKTLTVKYVYTLSFTVFTDNWNHSSVTNRFAWLVVFMSDWRFTTVFRISGMLYPLTLLKLTEYLRIIKLQLLGWFENWKSFVIVIVLIILLEHIVSESMNSVIININYFETCYQ